MSEEEVANIEGLRVQIVRLQGGKGLQDVKSCVLKALRDEAKAQVHGIWRRNKYIKHKELCALIRTIIIIIFTWNVTSLMPQAVNHLWEVLLVSSFCQSEDDLHEVSVHQSTVCTFCCLQSLTNGGETTEKQKNKYMKQTSFPFVLPVSLHIKQLREDTHTFLKLSMSPFSAYTFSREMYVSVPGSIPAPFITVRMFLALSMSLKWTVFLNY